MAFDPVLEKRLDEWQGWCFAVKNNNVGYPTQSPLVAVIEVGIFHTHFGPREPYLNPRAMEISMLVKVMALSFPLYAEALIDSYMSGLNNAGIAALREVNVRTVKQRVQSAKIWLSGALAKKETDIEKLVGHNKKNISQRA